MLYRTQTQGDYGLERVLGELHPRARWTGHSLIIDAPATERAPAPRRRAAAHAQRVRLAGLATITDPPARPALIYPARGIAELWQPAPTTHSQALSHLLGQTRAALLESLAEPASTHTLARRHELAPSTVSEHLAILHHAHLITRRRHRHTVLYQQAPLGAELAHGSYARGTTGWLSGPWTAMRKGLTSWSAQRARQPVLITGCSSGIGRAAALSLHRAGFTVYATARRTEHTHRPEQPRPAHAGAGRHGRGVHDAGRGGRRGRRRDAVGVLINNAGYGLYGPVEQLPMAEIRRQFETNFFGLVRLTQLVLPGMRRRGRGRILNVSSMGGRITLPGGAFYHASKYAVEALSDALRMEVAQFGIDVVLIEPGPVKTPWNDVAAGSLASGRGDGRRRPRRGCLPGVQGRGRRLVRQDPGRPVRAPRLHP